MDRNQKRERVIMRIWPGMVLMMLWIHPLQGEDAPSPEESLEELAEAEALNAPGPIGYVDRDGDGFNDLFRDADGDGVDDVSGQAYRHRFRRVDDNQDGINDLFIDRDGDGVNDLDGSYLDEDADGICDNVIDHDGDGINDVTGLEYDPQSLEKSRYGRINEDPAELRRPAVDEDGGERDEPGVGFRESWRLDRFIDEDGDGIHDGRVMRGTQGLRGLLIERRRRADSGDDRDRKANEIDDIEAALRAAVERGDLTAEQARERWEAARGRDIQDGERLRRERMPADRSGEDDERVRPERSEEDEQRASREGD